MIISSPEAFIPPYRVGKPFDFVSDGIFDADPTRKIPSHCEFDGFNDKYLYEATGQRAGIGTVTSLIDDPKNAGRISKAIDAEFENSDAQTKTETEQAFRASFIAMAGNLALLLNGIGLAVAFTILLVTANTMSIAVRERQQEIGVLKTLGFPSGLVMALVLTEALLLGAMGGALGLFFADGMIHALPSIPFVGDVVRQFPGLGLSPKLIAYGLGSALLLGLLAGFVPAILAVASFEASHGSTDLTYNVRNLRSRWKVTLLAIWRHRPGGGGVGDDPVHGARLQDRAEFHRLRQQRHRHAARLDVGADLVDGRRRTRTSIAGRSAGGARR